MDINTYNHLQNFLLTLTYPPSSTLSQQHQLRKQASNFVIINNQLHWKNKKNPSQPLIVIKEMELETVLHNLHDNPLGGHLRRDIVYKKANCRYY